MKPMPPCSWIVAGRGPRPPVLREHGGDEVAGFARGRRDATGGAKSADRLPDFRKSRGSSGQPDGAACAACAARAAAARPSSRIRSRRHRSGLPVTNGRPLLPPAAHSRRSLPSARPSSRPAAQNPRFWRLATNRRGDQDAVQIGNGSRAVRANAPSLASGARCGGRGPVRGPSHLCKRCNQRHRRHDSVVSV